MQSFIISNVSFSSTNETKWVNIAYLMTNKTNFQYCWGLSFISHKVWKKWWQDSQNCISKPVQPYDLAWTKKKNVIVWCAYICISSEGEGLPSRWPVAGRKGSWYSLRSGWLAAAHPTSCEERSGNCRCWGPPHYPVTHHTAKLSVFIWHSMPMEDCTETPIQLHTSSKHRFTTSQAREGAPYAKYRWNYSLHPALTAYALAKWFYSRCVPIFAYFLLRLVFIFELVLHFLSFVVVVLVEGRLTDSGSSWILHTTKYTDIYYSEKCQVFYSLFHKNVSYWTAHFT